MSKLNRMSYHARRILGQLCQCQKGKGKVLDGFDTMYASTLSKRGYIERLWFGQDLIAIATDSGREAWNEFKNQGANQ